MRQLTGRLPLDRFEAAFTDGFIEMDFRPDPRIDDIDGGPQPGVDCFTFTCAEPEHCPNVDMLRGVLKRIVQPDGAVLKKLRIEIEHVSVPLDYLVLDRDERVRWLRGTIGCPPNTCS